MNPWRLGLAAAGAAGLASVVRGMMHHVDDLRLECHTLPLKGWPESHRGYRIAVLADLHLGGDWSSRRARRAVEMALAAEPNFVALVGDYVNVWQSDSPRWIGDTLAPLRAMNGAVAAVPGNHDYQLGVPSLLKPIFDELDIRLLRNEHFRHDGIAWVGVDSAVEGKDRPELAMHGVEGPAVCLWHEPDLVDRLPQGCSLMLSGHAHGGQGKLLRRFRPFKTKLGSLYVDGFFPNTPTPLYVSRGVGTTLFPVRIEVPPEVSILTLIPG